MSPTIADQELPPVKVLKLSKETLESFADNWKMGQTTSTCTTYSQECYTEASHTETCPTGCSIGCGGCPTGAGCVTQSC